MKKQETRSMGSPEAPKGVKAYLIVQDKKHEAAIDDLTEKYRRLEKAVEEQSEEIKELEGLMRKQDLYKPFIDMTERFLARFERMLEDATQGNVYLRYKNSLSQRERELIQEEKELRLLMARCRRKINSLLRAVERGSRRMRDFSRTDAPGADYRAEAAAVSESNEPSAAGASAAGAAVPGAAAPAVAPTDGAAGGPNGLKLLYLLDKKAGKDLCGRGGEVLVREGEAICMNTAEKIYHQGLLEQLVQNMR